MLGSKKNYILMFVTFLIAFQFLVIYFRIISINPIFKIYFLPCCDGL